MDKCKKCCKFFVSIILSFTIIVTYLPNAFFVSATVINGIDKTEICGFEDVNIDYVLMVQDGGWHSVKNKCQINVSNLHSRVGDNSLHFVSTTQDEKSAYIYFKELAPQVGKYVNISVWVDSNYAGLNSIQLFYRQANNVIKPGDLYSFSPNVTNRIEDSEYPMDCWVTVSTYIPNNADISGGFGVLIKSNGENGYNRSLYFDDLYVSSVKPIDDDRCMVKDTFSTVNSVISIRDVDLNTTSLLKTETACNNSALRFYTDVADSNAYYIQLSSMSNVMAGNWFNARIKVPQIADNVKFGFFYSLNGISPILLNDFYVVDSAGPSVIKSDIWQIISFKMPTSISYNCLGLYVSGLSPDSTVKDFYLDTVFESCEALDGERFESSIAAMSYYYDTSAEYIKVAPDSKISDIENNFVIPIGTLKNTDRSNSMHTGSIIEWLIDDVSIKEYKVAIRGDLDCDGELSANDLVILRRYLLGSDNISSAQLAAADVSYFDKAVDLRDLVALKKACVKEANFNAGSFECGIGSDYINTVQTNVWSQEKKYIAELSDEHFCTGQKSLHLKTFSGAAKGQYFFFNQEIMFPMKSVVSLKVFVPKSSNTENICLFYKQVYDGLIRKGEISYFSDPGDGSISEDCIKPKGEWVTLYLNIPSNIELNSIGVATTTSGSSNDGFEVFIDDYDSSEDKNQEFANYPVLSMSDSVADRTKALKAYLKSIYGYYTLSGQQFQTLKNPEIAYIYKATGKLPALRSFDMNGLDRVSGDSKTISEAVNWFKNCNGIVSLMWHWSVPRDVTDLSQGYSYRKLYDNNDGTTFSVNNAVTVGTDEYNYIISSIDGMAYQLKKFKELGIPIIWRPLHEASGGWFWWGSGTSADYIKLWNIMYDRLTNYHKLDNLIWVWNGQSSTWLPDLSTFDIAGYDNYSTEDTLRYDWYRTLNSCTDGKMLALTEVGGIPTVSNMISNNARWLFWNTWYGDYAFTTVNGELSAPDTYTFESQLIANYQSRYVITLDELPLLAYDNRRDVPDVIKYYDNHGCIEGGNPIWENDSITLEFEFGDLEGCKIFCDDVSSGFGFVHWPGWETPSSAMVNVDVPDGKQGLYKVEIYYYAPFGTKYNPLVYNGNSTSLLKFNETTNTELSCVNVDIELESGKNTIGFTSEVYGHGWIRPDCIKLFKK